MKLIDSDMQSELGKSIAKAGGILLVLGLFCLFAVYRCGLAGWKLTEGGGVFANALISGENAWLPITGNITTCYTVFLSFLLSVFGNYEEVVLWSNIVLLLMILVLAYGIGRARKNFTSGLLLMLVIGIVASLSIPLTSDDGSYFFCFFAALLFALIEGYDNKSRESDGNIILVLGLFLGLFLGLCIYVEPLFMTIFFVFTFLRTFGNKEISLGECWMRNGVFTAGALVSILGTFGLESYLCSASYERVLQLWWVDRLSEPFDWISYISYFALLLLGLLVEAVTSRETLEKEEEDEDIEEEAEVQEAWEAVPVEAEPEKKETVAENVGVWAALEEEKTSSVPVETEPAPKPIKYIENPLPVPKRHVKKEMDYAFEPSRELMHYDFNNYRADDDYDLKDV